MNTFITKKNAAILAIILIIGTAIVNAFSPASSQPIDKATQLKNEIQSLVASTNSGITAVVQDATAKKEQAEKDIIRLTLCIERNNKAIAENNTISIDKFVTT